MWAGVGWDEVVIDSGAAAVAETVVSSLVAEHCVGLGSRPTRWMYLEAGSLFPVLEYIESGINLKNL